MRCALENTRNWKQRNPEKSKADSLNWYYKNTELAQATTRKWRDANKEWDSQRTRLWQINNPLYVRKAAHNRRALLRGYSYKIEHAESILRLQGDRCSYCEADADLQINHVLPLSRGGLNIITNLQWLCAFHNQSKNNLTDHEYRSKMGFLPVERHLSLAIWSAALAI